MTETHGHKPVSQPRHFSVAERQRILDRLLAALQKDPRIVGVLIVGSGAEGFEDRYSDIDLCAVIARGEDVHATFQAWGEKLQQLLPVFYRGESVRGPNSYLWVLLLDSFLEIDISFLCLEDLQARRGRWKTAFDRTGSIEERMQRSWAGRGGPDLHQTYDHHVRWIWHHVIHASVAIQRGQTWKALYELEQIRNQAIELRGLRMGLDTKRFRHVDQLPREFLSRMERTLARSLEPTEIMGALREATACFFDEAKDWDEMPDPNLVTRFERKLTDYLALIEGIDREVDQNEL